MEIRPNQSPTRPLSSASTKLNTIIASNRRKQLIMKAITILAVVIFSSMTIRYFGYQNIKHYARIFPRDQKRPTSKQQVLVSHYRQFTLSDSATNSSADNVTISSSSSSSSSAAASLSPLSKNVTIDANSHDGELEISSHLSTNKTTNEVEGTGRDFSGHSKRSQTNSFIAKRSIPTKQTKIVSKQKTTRFQSPRVTPNNRTKTESFMPTKTTREDEKFLTTMIAAEKLPNINASKLPFSNISKPKFTNKLIKLTKITTNYYKNINEYLKTSKRAEKIEINFAEKNRSKIEQIDSLNINKPLNSTTNSDKNIAKHLNIKNNDLNLRNDSKNSNDSILLESTLKIDNDSLNFELNYTRIKQESDKNVSRHNNEQKILDNESNSTLTSKILNSKNNSSDLYNNKLKIYSSSEFSAINKQTTLNGTSQTSFKVENRTKIRVSTSPITTKSSQIQNKNFTYPSTILITHSTISPKKSSVSITTTNIPTTIMTLPSPKTLNLTEASNIEWKFSENDPCVPTEHTERRRNFCSKTKIKGFKYDFRSKSCVSVYINSCQLKSNFFFDHYMCNKLCNKRLKKCFSKYRAYNPMKARCEKSSSGCKNNCLPKFSVINRCFAPKLSITNSCQIKRYKIWIYDARLQKCKIEYQCFGIRIAVHSKFSWINANRFENEVECNKYCVNRRPENICLLPGDLGTKLVNIYTKTYFYFDINSKRCQPIKFRGSFGNFNLFKSRIDCQQICHSMIIIDTDRTTFIDRANAPNHPTQSEKLNRGFNYFINSTQYLCRNIRYARNRKQSGPCRKYSFNWAISRCRKAHHTDQFQMTNCFDSMQECEDVCLPVYKKLIKSKKKRCIFSKKYSFRRRSRVNRWFLNKEKASCSKKRVKKNFSKKGYKTKRECESDCKLVPVPTYKLNDICQLAPKVYIPNDRFKLKSQFSYKIQSAFTFKKGVCKKVQRWNLPEEFSKLIYGNVFVNRKTCEWVCKSNKICSLPVDAGPCQQWPPAIKWHYDLKTHTCREFEYGGCLGNRNRFDSLIDCSSSCDFHKVDLTLKINVYKSRKTIDQQCLLQYESNVMQNPKFSILVKQCSKLRFIYRYYFIESTGQCRAKKIFYCKLEQIAYNLIAGFAEESNCLQQCKVLLPSNRTLRPCNIAELNCPNFGYVYDPYSRPVCSCRERFTCPENFYPDTTRQLCIRLPNSTVELLRFCYFSTSNARCNAAFITKNYDLQELCILCQNKFRNGITQYRRPNDLSCPNLGQMNGREMCGTSFASQKLVGASAGPNCNNDYECAHINTNNAQGPRQICCQWCTDVQSRAINRCMIAVKDIARLTNLSLINNRRIYSDNRYNYLSTRKKINWRFIKKSDFLFAVIPETMVTLFCPFQSYDNLQFKWTDNRNASIWTYQPHITWKFNPNRDSGNWKCTLNSKKILSQSAIFHLHSASISTVKNNENEEESIEGMRCDLEACSWSNSNGIINWYQIFENTLRLIIEFSKKNFIKGLESKPGIPKHPNFMCECETKFGVTRRTFFVDY